MNTKQIISLAIIATLPFGALADYTYVETNTPARVAADGTATRTNWGPYYQTITITNDDASHVASTAYIKGAYNDAIAAVNTRQVELTNVATGDPIDSEILDTGSFISYLTSGNTSGDRYEHLLISEAAVAAGILSQRAEVYTNWDDDTAKTEVAFVTASQE